jgi:hypothetical protein
MIPNLSCSLPWSFPNKYMQQQEKNNYFLIHSFILQLSQAFKVQTSSTITVFMKICTAITKISQQLRSVGIAC